MKKIIKYKTFSFSHEFEKWQKENDDVKIIQIYPMIRELSGAQTGEHEVLVDTEVGIFVTYYEEKSYEEYP